MKPTTADNTYTGKGGSKPDQAENGKGGNNLGEGYRPSEVFVLRLSEITDAGPPLKRNSGSRQAVRILNPKALPRSGKSD